MLVKCDTLESLDYDLVVRVTVLLTSVEASSRDSKFIMLLTHNARSARSDDLLARTSSM
jgi:hypothetical protein